MKAAEIWRVILKARAFSYPGFPNSMRHDRAVQFVSMPLQTAAAKAGITCHSVGIEAADAMGIGDRVHGPIRKELCADT